MAAPTIVISSQARVGTNVDVEGWITGNPTSATVRLPAAATPAGAVSKAAQAITIRPNGFFSVRFAAVNAGFYDGAIVEATNADGTTTATGAPQRIYANGTAPVGNPVLVFPPKPALSPVASVSAGAVATDVRLQSTSGSAQNNIPFTFGHYFEKGDLLFTDSLVGRIAGEADVALQVNAKATHPDGSLRHAIISGVLPSIGANATKNMDLVRATTSAVSFTPATTSAVAASGATASITATVGGTAYSASLADALAAASLWFGGAVATDYTAIVPLKDSGGTAHPHLIGYFSIRFYPGANRAKIDLAIEHTKAFTAVADITYDGAMAVGGTPGYAKAGLVQAAHTRWKKSFWWNGKPELHVKYNRDYMIDSKVVPNYDRTIVPLESELALYVTEMAEPKFDPLKEGRYSVDLTGQGGKPYLGILPDTNAMFALSQDKRAFDVMCAQADLGGYRVHIRDMGTGPASGKPMDVNHYPKASLKGTTGDAANTSTGVNEHLGAVTTATILNQDTAHQPSVAYLPYVVTGDHYYLEEMLFWSHWNQLDQNPGAINLGDQSVHGSYYRQWHRGYLNISQVRGQAWGFRSLAQAAAITPDDYHAKRSLEYWVEGNIANWDALYTDKPGTTNPLHIIDSAGSIIYNDHPVTGNDQTGIANFQESYWAQALATARELGFDKVNRLMTWKVKWSVDQFIAPGICFNDAALYQVYVRDSSASPMYATMAEVAAATIPAPIRALPCNSQERVTLTNSAPYRTGAFNPYVIGDIREGGDSAYGTASNSGPTIAHAVDIGYPDADLAWDLYSGRTQPINPPFSRYPEFAIVPRGYVAPDPIDPPEEPPEEPTIPTQGPPMSIADRVQETTTAISTTTITLLGAATHFKPFNNPKTPVGTTDIPVAVDDGNGNWENGMYTLTSATLLTRQSVEESSNNNQPVVFPAGVKKVSIAPLASQIKKLVDFAANGVEAAALPSTSPAMNHRVILTDSNGFAYSALVSALLALGGGTAPADTTAPVFAGGAAITSSNVTANGFTLTGPAATDAVGVARYEYSLDGGTTWTNNNLALSVIVTGRTASTAYPTRWRAVDAAGNASAALSLSVTTAAASGDTTAPSMSGSITVASITSSGYEMSYSAGSDNVAVDHYDTSIDGGTTWTNNALNLSRTVTGRSPGTTDNLRVRAVDAAGLTSNVLTGTATMLATKPATMAAPVATQTGATTASVALAAPSNGGSAITGYTVVSNPAGGVDSNAGTTALTHSMTGLTTGQAYTFTATATNAIGTSDPSPASNSVTPAAASAPVYTARTTSTPGGATLTSAQYPTAPIAMVDSTDDYAGPTARIYVLDANGDTPTDVKGVWGLSATVPPAGLTYASTTLPANTTGTHQARPAGFISLTKIGAWTTKGSAQYGLWGTTQVLAYGQPGLRYLWLYTSDGAVIVYDNNTGTAISITLTAPV